jgi:hypothetical protein
MRGQIYKISSIAILTLVLTIVSSFAKSTGEGGGAGVGNTSLDLVEAEYKRKYLNNVSRVDPLKLRNGKVGEIINEIQEKIEEKYLNFDLMFKLDRRGWFITKVPLSDDLLIFLGFDPDACKSDSNVKNAVSQKTNVIGCQDNTKIVLDGTWINNITVADQDVASLIIHEIMVLKLAGIASFWSHERIYLKENNESFIQEASMSRVEANKKRVRMVRQIVGFLFNHNESYDRSNALGETLMSFLPSVRETSLYDSSLGLLDVSSSAEFEEIAEDIGIELK